MDPYKPEVGDIGLMLLKGRTGLGVRAGQRCLGRKPKVGEHFGHVLIVADPWTVIQGGPGGVWSDSLAWYTDPAEEGAVTAFIRVEGLTDDQRRTIADEAWSRLDDPYAGRWGYLYLLLTFLGLLAAASRVEARMDRERMTLCSAFVDACYRAAGVRLTDLPSPHDVTPGDLATLACTDPRIKIVKEIPA